MNNRFHSVSIGIIPCVTAALACCGCGGLPEARTAGAAQEQSAATRQVATIRATRAAIQRTTSEPGQIEAFEVTAIHAKIAGYVQALAVDIGDTIKEGQILARLYVPEIDAELEQKRAMIEQSQADRRQAEAAVAVAQAAIHSAEAGIAEVQSTVRRADADVARWQSEYQRIDQLVREQAITGALLDETRSKLEAARAAREESAAKVRSAEAALAKAQAELAKARSDVSAAAARVDVAHAALRQTEAMAEYTKIVAPYTGVVTRRYVNSGHLTVPGGSSKPLFDVARTDKVRVAVDVPEADAPLVDPGDSAVVRLQALEGREFKGKVARISWALEPSTRTLRAEIDLENPTGALRPGLYAYATIIAEEHPNALTLPPSAVVQDGTRTYCVVAVDGKASRREIQTGLRDSQHVEILAGLNADEDVVATNPGSLTEGQPVQSQPQAAK